ncbi:GroES-like protein [Schizopora paradoxa]|uniref:GroES-like protein n=1 Tax=Schizopora paradoxa TaxID=27342 RepID=A0A0H2RZ32_9AGAM|nr:GroES-like protein [Schizopora paradoxa]
MSTITESAQSFPKTYKAGPNQGWKIIDVPVRPPGPHEVFIKILAAGLCGSDHFVEDGSWPGLQYPLTAGHENVGRVVSIGSEVSNHNGRLNPGGLVGVGWNGGYCGTCATCREGDFSGWHGEYMYAPETAVITIPEEALTKASYAELAPLFCAGATALIGGLGHLAIQYASKLGLRVYTLSSSSSKAGLAKSLGATGHIDASATPDVVEHIRSLSAAGDGAKLILCTAPYAKEISSILPAVGRNGTVTLVSAATDGNIEVSNLLLNMKRATLRGWSCGGGYETDECIRFSTLTGVKSMVKEFSLEQFTEAYQDLTNGRPQFRNVIVFPE